MSSSHQDDSSDRTGTDRPEAGRAALSQLAFRALNAVVRPLVERGFGNPPLVGIGPVIVETTGRRSGMARAVPLLSVRVGRQVIVSTGRERSQWFANLDTTPAAGVRLFGVDRRAVAELGRLGPLRTATLRLVDGD